MEEGKLHISGRLKFQINDETLKEKISATVFKRIFSSKDCLKITGNPLPGRALNPMSEQGGKTISGCYIKT